MTILDLAANLLKITIIDALEYKNPRKLIEIARKNNTLYSLPFQAMKLSRIHTRKDLIKLKFHEDYCYVRSGINLFLLKKEAKVFTTYKLSDHQLSLIDSEFDLTEEPKYLSIEQIKRFIRIIGPINRPGVFKPKHRKKSPLSQ